MFLMNDNPLPAGATVFQAIQQSVMAKDDGLGDDGMGDEGQAGLGAAGRGRGTQMWDNIHTLQYCLAPPPGSAAAAAQDAAGAGSSRGADGRQSSEVARRQGSIGGVGDAAGSSSSSQWCKSPLGELLHVQLPTSLAAPGSCLEILLLLQLLEVVNRLAPRLLASYELQLLSPPGSAPARRRSSSSNVAAVAAASEQMVSSQQMAAIAADQSHEGQMAMAHVHRDEFISTKLANKLAQQLKDVLSICGGSIPAWCHQLVTSSRFLFPFEVRRRYFYLTAFGLGRALHHMNQQQAAEGTGGALERDGRELRIGRLQRQKVRVSRRRILDSAVKVMDMYAKSRSVLELEYFGEVGTGLGPTLEFYTMLSHELQRKALGMWRHEEPPAADQQHQLEKPDQQQQQQQQQEADKPSQQVQQQQQAGAAAAAAPVALHQEVTSHEQASDSAADYVYAPYGLFPAPLPPAKRGSGSPVIEHFRLLGRSVAKALQDTRLMDLPINPVFFRAALGQALDLYDVSEVDPGLGASLERLARAAAAHAAAGGQGPLMVDGCLVDDLCLTFTLPGMCLREVRLGWRFSCGQRAACLRIVEGPNMWPGGLCEATPR
jgi:E3 ubiquitin-protein ligase TRIP12